MTKRRVVVTGLGIVSPVGSTVEGAWRNICGGMSGIRRITGYDVSEFPVQFAGTVVDFDADAYIGPKDQKKMDPFIHYGIGAAIDAIKDAGLVVTPENSERIGVSIGAGIGGIGSIEKNHLAMVNGSPRKISPFFVPASIINMISGNLSIMTGIKGPNLCTVTACTTGTHNIGLSARTIAYGDADVMIAGGAEMASTPLGICGFAAARALSSRNDAPEQASRPWDRDRDGFVLGDGAGVLVLESYDHAVNRGARIYCELAGFGMSGDAFHMTQPSEGGEGAARCMLNALRDAGLNPDQVDYINAHGTSTPAGDVAETLAVKRAFQAHAYRLAVSSTKSMTGHLLGAAGGIEAVFSILALRDQIIPPTINLENADPQCDLDYVPGSARQARLNAVLSNSFGFGGTNGTLVFRRV
ncbi:MAG: beta-ketoacyl-ACP synthase II [Thiotrichales bacterium]